MGETWNFWLASALLASTIVGVGMFGIPFAVHQAGLAPGLFYLFVLGGVVLVVHLAYGEVVMRGGAKHRLVGYSEHYLGESGRLIALFATVFGLLGALLAYILVGGVFLFTIFHSLFPFLPREAFTMLFIVFGAVGIASGARTIAEIELAGSVLLALMVVALFAIGLPHMRGLSFYDITWSRILVPYGVIIFALGGRTAIEEMRESFMASGGRYRRAIIVGTIIPIFLYLLFTLVVLGVSGADVSEEAFQGLHGKLGEPIIIFGALLGIFAVATSYLTIGLNVVKTFWYDIRIPRWGALALTIGLPLVAYLGHVTDFIGIIATVGVVMGGTEGILILLMHVRAQRMGGERPGYVFRIPPFVRYTIIAVFIFGIAYHLISYPFF